MRFGFIGDLLRGLLDLIYKVIPNYGWAILVFVLIIRMCLLPLEIKSRRGMKRMQEVQPMLEELNKKYAKDKERLNQKTADLYKKEKISPMSGCLPMLLTFPILFAMFAVMRDVANEKTVEMILNIKTAIEAGNLEYRPVLEGFLWIKNVFQPDSFMSTVIPTDTNVFMGMEAYRSLTADMIAEAKAFMETAEYALWSNNYMATSGYAVQLQNLWSKFGWVWDGYTAPLLMWTISIPQSFNGLFLLPVLSALTQFAASKFMNTNTPAPSKDNPQQQSNQAMMKWFFPLFSLWICATSNAGFALYWVFANIIQVIQQIVINKWIDYSDSKKKVIEEAGK